jgi:riboflavin kinase/FMN adenylyltransferase
MRYHNDLNELHLENCWLTIGSYDGVHLGHQQIIHPLVEGARQKGISSVVVTFHPHPQLVINDENRPFYLTLPEQRAMILGALGVDHVVIYPFTKETSRLGAEEFILSVYNQLHFSNLWVGHDFALGRDREGDIDLLKKIGENLGYQVQDVPPYIYDNDVISSSLIRRKLRSGEIKAANNLMGRPLEVVGEVIRGDNRGKSLGFATSNLDVPGDVVDIMPGVYACWAEVLGETWKAVTNIGYRPTFGGGLTSPRIEAHLLDFSQDLYGEKMGLRFVERIRDEMKFDQVSDLQAQVSEDINKTHQILGEYRASLPTTSSLV